MFNKILLAAIAAGLWANAFATMLQPARAATSSSEWLETIAYNTGEIQDQLSELLRGGPKCKNAKICD